MTDTVKQLTNIAQIAKRMRDTINEEPDQTDSAKRAAKVLTDMVNLSEIIATELVMIREKIRR